MRSTRRITAAIFVGLVGIGGSLALAAAGEHRAIRGTIWAANRGSHTIRGFDARTGVVVNTIDMAPSSQPGDLAYAKRKLYVAEEFGTPPAIAILDSATGQVLSRLTLPAGARPHHVHASRGGNLVAVGLYGTDLVAVIDTHSDLLLGPWDSNPATTTGRVHAAGFSSDGNTIYLASDATSELIAMDPRTGAIAWRMTVPGIHELIVTHNGKHAYASRRTANMLALIDLEQQTFQDVLALGLPDTLQLSANEKLLTVGLRASPARLAVVDTRTLAYELVTLSAEGEATTIGGHQWTSPSGRYTFASYEGGANPGLAVIDHRAGNRVVQRLSYPGRPHGVTRARP
jgi:DNA-binding beta-propeller fold protein YncE